VHQGITDMLNELLRRTHLSAPSDLAEVIAQCAASMGASDVELYLIDYDFVSLVPIGPGRQGGETLSVAGTVAGRSFSATTILEAPPREGSRGHRLWLPLLDGTERLGVMGLTFAAAPDERTIAAAERYAHLTVALVVTKSAYGDVFEKARRRRPMTVAAELLWSLVPPLVFATDGLVLAGMLEPCYDNGGDALDYAVDDGVLHVAIFDAMGHGLAAAGLAAFAVAAYRHSRRAGDGLLETYTAMDNAIAQQFEGDRFVTALIARLDIGAGHLSWVSAGHPPPLVLRDGRRARTLGAPPATPLGVEHDGAVQIAHTALEPGDMLMLYTDGLTEARGADGQRFTVQRLSEFIEREAASGLSVPETLRRLRQSIVGRHGARLDDDATALLIEWHRGGERRLLPPTVVDPA